MSSPQCLCAIEETPPSRPSEWVLHKPRAHVGGRAWLPRVGELHDVVLAGNNWDGTVTILDPHTLAKIATIDVVPDLTARFDPVNQDRRRAQRR